MASRRLGTFVAGVALACTWAAAGGPVTAPVAVAAAAAGAEQEPVLPPGVPTARVGSGWTVRATGDGFTVSWRSTTPLPVTASRPVVLLDGEPLTTVVVDERTVATADPLRARPDLSRLAVRLGGVLLDSGRRVAPRAGTAEGMVVDAGDVLDIDPAAPGPHEVVTSDYDAGDLPQPGFGVPMDVLGHVVQPAPGEVAGPRPLVLFLHGRHSYCYSPDRDRDVDTWTWPCADGAVPVPSMLGYDYLQRLLASQGYVTVSIDANAVNAQDWASLDGGATARGRLVERHLRLWQQWAAEGTQPVDMDQVVLVGHSRGGEGVHRGAQLSGPGDPWNVAGIVHIAPVDFSQQTTSYVPTVVLLPSCDGDVYDLQGQTYTDLARDVVAGDDALHSSVLVIGANHNFFNTEWTPVISAAPSFDDGGWVPGCRRSEETRLSPAEQRRSARAYVAAATHVLLDPASEDVRALDGTPGHIASAGDHAVRTHALGAGRDVRRVRRDATPSPVVGPMTSEVCHNGARGATRCAGDQASPHWLQYWPRQPRQPELRLAWTEAGGRGGLDLARPLDLTAADHLDLRTIVAPGHGRPRVRVRLTDAAGASASVVPSTGRRLQPLAGRHLYAGGFAQAVRVDVAGLTGLDLAEVVRVEVEALSAAGELYLLDVAAVPTALPAAPAQRQAVVDLGRLRVPEGDDADQLLELPWSVEGVVARDSWFLVRPMWEWWSEGAMPSQVLRVAVPAGSSSGSVSLPIPGNVIDDRRVRRLPVVARPGRGVMVREDAGELRVVDDDPAPEVTVRRRSRVVREGEKAVVDVRVSAPTGYPLFFTAHALEVDSGEPLRVGDLPRRWFRRNYGDRPDRRVFAGRWTMRGAWRDPGARRLSIRFPVRADGVREGREVLEVRVRSRRLPRIDRTLRFVVRD